MIEFWKFVFYPNIEEKSKFIYEEVKGMSDKAGDMTAQKRIMKLLDAGSFVETGAEVTARNTDFNLQQADTPSDGVITGYGMIEGNLVFIYSQDSAVLNGTIGEMHAKKIVDIYNKALKMRAPVIGLVDCAGIRLQEAVDALEAFGSIYNMQSCASGVIPQITVIFGSCGGGLAVFPRLTDFTFMEEKEGKLFVNSPNVLADSESPKSNICTAEYQSKCTGAVDAVGTSTEILEQIRSLISILPLNYEEGIVYNRGTDDLNRICKGIENIREQPVALLKMLSDNGYFFETKREFAKDMITGFIRLNGITVGVAANGLQTEDEEGNSVYHDGVLTSDGCKKAAAFINYCDAFSIPVLSFTNVTGYEATEEVEKSAPESVAKLIYAFSSASVPKVNVIIGKAYGSAYVAMNSKSLGADLVYAWPDAEIGMMDANLAAKIMYAGQEQSLIKEKADAYRELQTRPLAAARRGYVDKIIAPEETRKYLISAFEMLSEKKEYKIDKKHGTV